MIDAECNEIYLDDYDFIKVIRDNDNETIIEAKDLHTNIHVLIESSKNDSMMKNIINLSNMGIQGIDKIIGYHSPLSKKEKYDSPYFDCDIKGKSVNLTNFIIVRNLYDHGSIKDNIKIFQSKSKVDLPPTAVSKIIFGVAAIMKNLHQSNIILGNLCLENIFLDSRLEPNIRILGSLDDLEKQDMLSENPIYMAPERFQGESESTCTFATDVYSYAIFLYRMFEPDILLEGDKVSNMRFQKIKDRIIKKSRPKQTSNIPINYWNLIQECWSDEPDNRPTFEGIVKELEKEEFALKGTNIKQLCKYQKEIVDGKIQRLQKRLQLYKTFFTYPKLDKRNLYIENEKSYRQVEEIEEEKEKITTDYLVIDNRTGQKKIKKVLDLSEDSSNYDNAVTSIKENEKEYLINYPSFIQISAIELQSKSNHIISFFLESSETRLSDLLKNDFCNHILKPTLKVHIIIEIVHAMKFLHKNKIIYGFLNVDNILFNPVYEVKLENVGFLKTINNYKDFSTTSLEYNDHLSKNDVYSFGFVLYSIFTGEILNDYEDYSKPKSNDNISNECIELIEKCINEDENKRPSFDEILESIRKYKYALLTYFDSQVIKRRDDELSYLEAQMNI